MNQKLVESFKCPAYKAKTFFEETLILGKIPTDLEFLCVKTLYSDLHLSLIIPAD